MKYSSLFKIDLLLRQGNLVTLARLCRECECGERTIFRYLSELREVGGRKISANADGRGYYLSETPAEDLAACLFGDDIGAQDVTILRAIGSECPLTLKAQSAWRTYPDVSPLVVTNGRKGVTLFAGVGLTNDLKAFRLSKVRVLYVDENSRPLSQEIRNRLMLAVADHLAGKLEVHFSE
ncbi:MAG: hypothetical protein EXS25_02615 [Pedosphaera sp.]|nr:hypothetical protein [Pedosphaera sp.]